MQETIRDGITKRRELVEKDRYCIEKLLARGASTCEIADVLGVSARTIRREIKRGMVEQMDTFLVKHLVYRADYAQGVHDFLASNRGAPLLLVRYSDILEEIEKKLRKHWSPDAIVGMLRRMGKSAMCTKTLYNWLYNGYIEGFKWEKRRRKGKIKLRVSYKNPMARSITERPIEAEERLPGHWEMDLVLSGAGLSGCLLVLTERSSRYEHIIQLPDKTQSSVKAGLDKLERQYKGAFKQEFKTITCDNGSEFLDTVSLESSCLYDGKRTTIYYAHPYSAWERGSNENANKLIRKFIKKGEDIGKLPQAYIKRIEKYINNYPRKIFGYRTAAEVKAEAIRE